ncbi:thiamine phosphate synthase [Anaerostipes sp. MSJ-23]|uniref:thiamine phosphate synthase n=1 Tax=unclassified Anaerostipes TaxID=2635253 RepID=UPI00209E5493|nr:thiamine phosphate synthase [Anaerostipes sp. MSJ-23]
MKVKSEQMTVYAVTDRAWTGEKSLMEQVKEALEGGITFLQLREKKLSKEAFLQEAKEMKQLAEKYKVPFVINDNIEIAQKSGADGVHVGQDDMPVEEVRKILGEDKIIGVSAHNVEEALKAQKGGADYLGVGAVCQTATKSDASVVSMEEMKKICESVSIPVVAIGGIHKDNLSMLENTGVDGIAVVSAIFAAKDIKEAARELFAKVSKIKEK